MTDDQWEKVCMLHAALERAGEHIRLLEARSVPNSARERLEFDIEVFHAKDQQTSLRAELKETLSVMGLIR